MAYYEIAITQQVRFGGNVIMYGCQATSADQALRFARLGYNLEHKRTSSAHVEMERPRVIREYTPGMHIITAGGGRVHVHQAPEPTVSPVVASVARKRQKQLRLF